MGIIKLNATQPESPAYQEGMEWIVKARGAGHHEALVESQKIEVLKT